MRLISACTLSILIVPLIWAQDSKLKIIGETKVAPYSLVKLKTEGAKGKGGFRWYVSAITLDGREDTERQAKVQWSTGNGERSKAPEWVGPPGDYKITFRETFNTEEGYPDWDEASLRITILSPGPVPPTPPNPPTPDPDVPTPPTPNPNNPPPVKAAGLRVLVIFDKSTGQSALLTRGQREIIWGADVQNWLRNNCITDANNPDGAYRIWDKNQNAIGDPDEVNWKAFQAYSKPTSLPWAVVGNGTNGYAYALPPEITGDKFIADMTKYIPKSKATPKSILPKKTLDKLTEQLKP